MVGSPHVPDSVDGRLLAAPGYPGKVMVEYELGQGRVIAAGTPNFGMFADRTPSPPPT